MLRLLSKNIDDTRLIAGAIARLTRPRDLIVLSGEMGAGKTAFAQGFSVALGVVEAVTSPTFNLVHNYVGAEHTIHHVDLYRLERTGELEDLGLAELLDSGGVMLVEWGEVVGDALGGALLVKLEHAESAEARSLSIERRGSQWDARWSMLEQVLRDWIVR